MIDTFEPESRSRAIKTSENRKVARLAYFANKFPNKQCKQNFSIFVSAEFFPMLKYGVVAAEAYKYNKTNISYIRPVYPIGGHKYRFKDVFTVESSTFSQVGGGDESGGEPHRR